MQNPILRNCSVVRDLTQPIDHLEAVTPFQVPIGTKINIEGKFYVCNGSYNSGESYIDILYSEEQMRVITSELKPITTECDVKSLLCKMGVSNNITLRTSTNKWVVSNGGVKALISDLMNQADVVNGGAPFFNLTLFGDIVMTDTKHIYDKGDKNYHELPYKVNSDDVDTAWTYNYPSRLRLVRQTLNGEPTSELIEMGKIGTTAKIVVDDRCGVEYNVAKRRYINEYNRLKYRSRVITFDDTNHACKVGDFVSVQGLDCVVDRVVVPIPMGDEISIPKVRAAMPY